MKPYNGVTIDSENGLYVMKSDSTIRTMLNATEGFKFQKNAGTLSAPTWTDMLFYDVNTGNLFIDGVVNARDLKVNGASVLTGDGKFKSSSLETLYVGKNVFMAPEARISWTQVTEQPNAAQLGGVMTNSPKMTYIDANGVYTGTVSANQINAGKIRSQYIDVEDLKVNRIYREYNDSSGYLQLSEVGAAGQSFGDLELWFSNERWFRVYNGGGGKVYLDVHDTSFLESDGTTTTALGNWEFKGKVTGVTATFA
ncbi:hypothetical protein [Paenibacillus sp. BIHB 4019]|nr:hypothetical protein [Paenibacillus sp. BIHB 4019]